MPGRTHPAGPEVAGRTHPTGPEVPGSPRGDGNTASSRETSAHIPPLSLGSAPAPTSTGCPLIPGLFREHPSSPRHTSELLVRPPGAPERCSAHFGILRAPAGDTRERPPPPMGFGHLRTGPRALRFSPECGPAVPAAADKQPLAAPRGAGVEAWAENVTSGE